MGGVRVSVTQYMIAYKIKFSSWAEEHKESLVSELGNAITF